VWFLGVEPSAQRAGHGRRALSAALDAMRARDHDVCILKTETAANVPYYQGLGFEIIDERVVPATQLRYWLFRRALR
jgi:ribosomal protein S18 acetylase RimI-like enzyme